MYWLEKKSKHGWKKRSLNRELFKEHKKNLIFTIIFEFSANNWAQAKAWSIKTSRHGSLALTYKVSGKHIGNWRLIDKL